MSEKELRHLKRSELIEIIYQLKKNEEKLLAENSELKRQLEEREIKIQNLGTLSEAALALSDIFSAADKAAEIYINEIKRRSDRDIV